MKKFNTEYCLGILLVFAGLFYFLNHELFESDSDNGFQEDWDNLKGDATNATKKIMQKYELQ